MINDHGRPVIKPLMCRKTKRILQSPKYLANLAFIVSFAVFQIATGPVRMQFDPEGPVFLHQLFC